MANELATRLRKLKDAHDAEVDDDDAYEAGLAKLRGRCGVAFYSSPAARARIAEMLRNMRPLNSSPTSAISGFQRFSGSDVARGTPLTNPAAISYNRYPAPPGRHPIPRPIASVTVLELAAI